MIADDSKVKERIGYLLEQYPVLLFIKGTVEFPQCGFSRDMVEIFKEIRMETGIPFETVDVMADEPLRQAMKDLSCWPAFPQVYLAGEFVGGSQVVRRIHINERKLKSMVERAVDKHESGEK